MNAPTPVAGSYSLVEETHPGEYFPALEDESGTFIFNSNDLCLLHYLPELAGSGIDSLKIEGSDERYPLCRHGSQGLPGSA